MKIIAGGDSFVWGSELADCPHSGPGAYSRNTFAALLADDYVCAAYPGNGNDAITRNTIISCEENKHDNIGVIVSWTFPGRYEFNFSFDAQANWQTINHWSIGNQFYQEDVKHKELVDRQQELAHKNGIYDFATNYYRHVGSSEYWEIYTMLKEIVYLQSYLRSNNIPYMFTCADMEFVNSYTILNSDSTITSLYNQIDFTKWFIFPDNKGFYAWAVANKYSISGTHPLEQAHRDAAYLMKDKFDELVKKIN